jgi:hypothetical protein
MRVNTKMWTPAGTTFTPPPEPEYKVFVAVARGSILEFSAHSVTEAWRIATEYREDYPIKVVPRGNDAADTLWTLPPLGAPKVAEQLPAYQCDEQVF